MCKEQRREADAKANAKGNKEEQCHPPNKNYFYVYNNTSSSVNYDNAGRNDVDWLGIQQLAGDHGRHERRPARWANGNAGGKVHGHGDKRGAGREKPEPEPEPETVPSKLKRVSHGGRQAFNGVGVIATPSRCKQWLLTRGRHNDVSHGWWAVHYTLRSSNLF